MPDIVMTPDPEPVVVLHPAEAALYGMKRGDVFEGAKVVIADKPLTFGDPASMLARLLAVTLLAIALTACGPKREDPPICPTTPVVVDRVVETRADIPAYLIEPLDDPTNDQPVILGQTTVGEATTWAEQRRAIVARCQADRASLRALEVRSK